MGPSAIAPARRGGGLAGTPLLGSPAVPAEGGPKNFKLRCSWRRRRLSKILAVSLKHGKGRRGGGVGGGGPAGGYPPSSYSVRPF